MDIINENIPYEKEKINLILTSSLLKNSNDIIYNLNKKNFILIDNYYLEYSSIFIDSNPNNNKLPLITENSLINKDDYSLIILTESDLESNIYLNTLQELLNKNNFSGHNINSISINYSYMNEKNKMYQANDLSHIPKIENNNLFIKIKLEYNNEIIYSSFKIFFINHSYNNILPLLCVNHKDFELIFIKKKINKLLSEEKKIQNIINKMPILNNDFIEKINSFKNETFDYFSKFIKNIERMSNKFNNQSLTKNDINSFIKEINDFMDKINKENYKNKQNDIYKEYIKIYNNIDKINIINNNEDLKSLFIIFNNVNEEIANLLEKSDINKKETTNLKNIIKIVQNQLKEEKSKNIKKRNFINDNYNNNTIDSNMTESNNNTLIKQKESKKVSLFKTINANRPVSVRRYRIHHKKSISMDKTYNFHNKSYSNFKTDENDIKYLKKKINHLHDIISHLKSKNEILEKSNEKMKKDINNLNKIISKLHRNYQENNLMNELLPKSSSIKSFQPKKLYVKEKNNHSWQKRNNKNKSLVLDNNNIKNNNMNYNNKNINDNYYLDDEKHFTTLQKIHDENKNMLKTINNYHYKNTEIGTSGKNINKENNFEMNSPSVKREKKNKKVISKNLKISFNTDKKNHKSSAPKIKIFKSINHK